MSPDEFALYTPDCHDLLYGPFKRSLRDAGGYGRVGISLGQVQDILMDRILGLEQ